MWIVGDTFLKETSSDLYDLRDKAPQKQQLVPFIFKYFNVQGFYTNKGVRSRINRFLAPLVEALNKYHKLPKYLLIVPDKDLLSQLNWDNNISISIGAAIHYIVKQTNICVDRRRCTLSEVRPRAQLPAEFPKIVWLRMTKCPLNLVGGYVFSFRGRFNSILEERLLDGNAENHYIMSIEVEPNDFDIGGNFTSPGAATFWCEVSKAVQKLDAGEITL